MSKLNLERVQLKVVPPSAPGELAENLHYQCHFCKKHVGLPPEIRGICETISGELFHCPFCLRHGYNTKITKHVLGLSFRSVIGYYYYNFYINRPRKMWLTELRDYIEFHQRVGLQNPVFNYDPETFMWFVDFSKVGRGRKKIDVAEVLKSVMGILTCFNLYEYANGGMHTFYDKYREAIIKFHDNRYRPNDKDFLIPTLQMRDLPKGVGLDDIRSFVANQLEMFDQ